VDRRTPVLNLAIAASFAASGRASTSARSGAGSGSIERTFTSNRARLRLSGSGRIALASPASNRWFFEASEFPGEGVNDPLLKARPETLEAYLGLH
jgi:hypothetical protein